MAPFDFLRKRKNISFFFGFFFVHCMRVLHLVLYSPAAHYDAMAEATRKLYALHSDKVETYYYFCDPDVKTETIDEKGFLHLPGKETYIPGILDKTLRAIQFLFDPTKHACVVRSNVSTVLNWTHLLPCIARTPQLFYGGTFVMTSDNIGGYKQDSSDLLAFAQGTCLIFAPKAIEILLQHQHLLNRSVEDDPSFAILFRDVAKALPQKIGTQFAFFNANCNVDTISAFRHHTFHSDRKSDTLCVTQCAHALITRLALKKGCVVDRVWYHTTDVTDQLKHLASATTLATAGNNAILDKLFGDPAPGVVKHLHVLTQRDGVFSQKANLQFFIDPNTLFLCVK